MLKIVKMHILQPKHTKLGPGETKALLDKLNITKLQLPKIRKKDLALPSDIKIGDIIKIERKASFGGKTIYYRVVIP